HVPQDHRVLSTIQSQQSCQPSSRAAEHSPANPAKPPQWGVRRIVDRAARSREAICAMGEDPVCGQFLSSWNVLSSTLEHSTGTSQCDYLPRSICTLTSCSGWNVC